MPSRCRRIAFTAIALALMPLLAGAQPPDRPVPPTRINPSAADIPRSALQHRSTGSPVMSPAGAVTDADVGDADSFGRNLTWLGVDDMSVMLMADCAGSNPGTSCQELGPAGTSTSFAFEDLGHISLPARATHSMLCYWFSPFLQITYDNPTAAPVVAALNYSPTLTVENPVLDDPALIDPNTGLPFGGRLTAGMTSMEYFEKPLPAGGRIFELTRDSTVCIAGFLTREGLVMNYGLTESQARQFFREPTTVRLNISGNARYVGDAWLYFGFRIIGD